MRECPLRGCIYWIHNAKRACTFCLLIHNNCSDRLCVDVSKKTLPYQLSMVLSWRTMAFTGDGESGFDSGEGA
jgi:hypothetical protein